MPDDEARLKTKFRIASDASYEKDLTGQPRPNVLFEAGRAFGSHPDDTGGRSVGASCTSIRPGDAFMIQSLRDVPRPDAVVAEDSLGDRGFFGDGLTFACRDLAVFDCAVDTIARGECAGDAATERFAHHAHRADMAHRQREVAQQLKPVPRARREGRQIAGSFVSRLRDAFFIDRPIPLEGDDQ